MALTEIDRNLIKRCLVREPGAWRDFVDRFMGLFIHVIHHTLHAHSVRGKQDDIDDFCSEIFLEILADDLAVLRRFRGKSSLATYLTVIARRVIIRQLTRRRHSEALGHVEAHQEALSRAQVSSSHIQRIDDREEIESLMRTLSERDAAVIRQYHLEGKTYREIHDETGLSENSIGSILSRARDSLRDKNVEV